MASRVECNQVPFELLAVTEVNENIGLSQTRLKSKNWFLSWVFKKQHIVVLWNLLVRWSFDCSTWEYFRSGIWGWSATSVSDEASLEQLQSYSDFASYTDVLCASPDEWSLCFNSHTHRCVGTKLSRCQRQTMWRSLSKRLLKKVVKRVWEASRLYMIVVAVLEV